MAETIHTNQFLSNFAVRHKLPHPVADFVAPKMQVKRSSDKYSQYTQDIYRVYDNAILGREEAKEIQWEVTEQPYSCDEYGLAKFVSDRKKRNSDTPIAYDKDAVRYLKTYQAIAREYRVQQIGGNTGLIPSTAIGAAWATPATGTPVADILAAMAQIDAQIAIPPNKILVPTQVALRMITCDEWKDYFKHTGEGFGSGLFSAISGLRHLGLEPMLTSVRGLSTSKGTTSDPTVEEMWSDNVLLFYSEPTPTLETMTFMYSPYTIADRISTSRPARKRGVFHDIYEEIDELLVNAYCGRILENCI